MEARKADLTKLTRDIVPYLMEHNTEAEACDLLMEVEKLDDLEQYVDENAYQRVCLYLKRLVISITFLYSSLSSYIAVCIFYDHSCLIECLSHRQILVCMQIQFQTVNIQ